MRIQETVRKPMTEAKYLNVDNTDRYRPIMRLFYLKYEKLKYWLYQEEVYEELKEDAYFREYTPEQCQQDLAALTAWGNLVTIQDTRKVATIEEFKNKKFRYQLSEATVEIERMVIRVENLFIESSSLEPTLLERLRINLRKISEITEADQEHIYAWWNDLNNDFIRLNQNYQDYMRELNSVKAEEMMKTTEFLVFKDRLIEYLRSFVRSLQVNGVDVLDVSRGNIITAASMYEVPPIDVPNGFNIDNAARIRKETGMLTVGVGRINTAALAEEIISQDKVDMVVMGRAQLADPEFANKAHEGRIGDIVHCVGCNQGCYDGFTDVANRPHITCMRNPMIGHESEYDLSKTETPKKVWVVGGGVAGMEAAKILHERGHEVSLFEASDTLGGEFLLAGEAPGKAEMKAAAFEMAEQVEKLVKVYKNTKVDAQMLKDADVDAVILAIGSSPITIKLEGMDKLQHASAPEVLRHEVCPKGKVAVIGGGLVGLETADTLATDGCDVTVLEMKDEIGSDLGSLRKIAVMMKLQQMQVKMLPNSKVCKFTEEGIVLEDETLVPCNCAVFAVGFASNDSHLLVEECEKRQIPCRVIGDAKSARRALDAIAEGFEAARTL